MSDWAQSEIGDVIGVAGDDVQSLSGDLPGSGGGQNIQPTAQNAGSSGVLPGGPSLPGNDGSARPAAPDPGGSNGGGQNMQPLAQNGPSGEGVLAPLGPPTPFLDKYATQPAPHNPQELLNDLVGDAPAGPSMVMEMDVDAVLRAVQDYEDELGKMHSLRRKAEAVGAVEPPGEEDASRGFVNANRPPADSLKDAIMAQVKLVEERKQAFADSAHAVRKVDEQNAETLRMRE